MKKKDLNKNNVKALEFKNKIAEVINNFGFEEKFGNTPDYVLADVAYRAMENFAEGVRTRDAIKGVEETETTDEKNQEEPKIPEGVSMIAQFLSDVTGKPVHVKVMKSDEWERLEGKPGKKRQFRNGKKNKKIPPKSNQNAPF